MYFPAFGASGALEKLTLVPTRIRRFRVDRARGEDAQWLAAMLTREGARFGARVAREADESLTVHWR
jgi:poly-gamma-glutamate synthesis protein (capsule biosynthesis protein)